MRKGRLFRGQRVTVLMLLTASLFYAALLFFGVSSSKRETQEARDAQGQELKHLRQREAAFQDRFREHPSMTRAVSAGFLLVLFFGLYLDARLMAQRFTGRAWIPDAAVFGSSAWGILDVAQVFVFLFFAETVLAGSEMTVSAFFPLRNISDELLLMANSFVRNLAVTAFIFWVVCKKFGRRIEELGLTSRDLSKNLKLGFLGYVAVIPLLLLCLMLLTGVAQIFSYEPPPQKVVQIFLEEASSRSLVFFTLFVALVGPAIEEIFFRGFAYRAFRARVGAKWAMIVTAAIFAAFHMNFFIFLPVFFLGVFLAYLYEKTGSLVPSITAHVTHNLIMVTLTLFFKSLSVI